MDLHWSLLGSSATRGLSHQYGQCGQHCHVAYCIVDTHTYKPGILLANFWRYPQPYRLCPKHQQRSWDLWCLRSNHHCARGRIYQWLNAWWEVYSFGLNGIFSTNCFWLWTVMWYVCSGAPNVRNGCRNDITLTIQTSQSQHLVHIVE